jgi:transcriptional regulator GlxA family with amidase domain
MPPAVPVAIYLHARASLAFALLLETVFTAANRVAGRPVFAPTLLAGDAAPRRFRHGITLRQFETRLPRSGYLLIPPIDLFSGEFVETTGETRLLQRAHAAGLTLGSACLGSFLMAAAGLLDGVEATTHWRWGDYAAQRFQKVAWNTRAMLCAHSRVITAGGLLATVDLALHIVGQHCPKPVSREVGRHLLADSVRQKQSTYATSLVLQPRNGKAFAALESQWQDRLAKPFPIPEMAARCAMSVRTFHRAFTEAYGVSPGKYLQLRRVEKAKELLADARLTVEDVSSRCGFAQPSFFRTIFARETGLTPAQFRKRL